MDFGCGLGKHYIIFAKKGFDVSAFDLSDYGVKHLNTWAEKETLKINTDVLDMLRLPYEDESFDCLFAYNVISHTDSIGIVNIIDEIKRVLKPGAEFYLTLCSKETWSFKDAGYAIIDENNVLKIDGVEDNIPHFLVSLDDILTLFKDFKIESIRHIDDCYFAGEIRNSKRYFILGKK